MSFLSNLFRFTFSKPKVLNGTDRDYIKSRWNHIDELVRLGGSSQLKQAVIESDKLLEFILRKLINDQQSLGDNLKQAKDLFPSYSTYQQAWEAHKVRNALVHEAGYELPHYLAKQTIENFKMVFSALGAI